MGSFIYVIAESLEGPSKIGISIHPEKRVKQLQTGHSGVLKIFETFPIDAKKAQLMERIVHRENRSRRLKGEWFDLTVEQAIAEVKHSMIRFEDEVENKSLYRH